MDFELKYLKYKNKYISSKLTDTSNKVEGINIAPLYVTIGPPNSGKTTFLKTIPNLIDVAIDDDPEVYKHLPLEVIDNINNKNYDMSEYKFHNLELKDRIKKDGTNQQLHIYNYFTDKISIKKLKKNLQMDEEELKIYIPIIRKLKKKETKYTCKHFSIYIEEVFSPANYFVQKKTLERLENELSTKPDTPIAWGQTNFDITHYNKFLDLAIKYSRPLYFAVWNREFGKRKKTIEQDLKFLLERNILRFMKDGNYVPYKDIQNKLHSIDSILKQFPKKKTFDKDVLNSLNYKINSKHMVSKKL